MGILDGIVEWIAEQVMAGLDLITTSVLGALGCDMAVFLRYFPAAETMYSVFVALGIGIILLNWVWQLFKNFGLGAGIEAEDPLKLSIRSVIFILLAFFSNEIVSMILTIGGTPYNWIMDSELPALSFADFNSVMLVIIGVCANGAVALITLILVIILAWNYLKLLLEAAERYVLLGVLVYTAPVFGVETSILARDLAWDWIGDAHERFSVGDEVLVRILNVRRNSLEDLGIRADIKSTSENTDRDNLQKCRIQGKYAGKVTDVHKGVVYVRLANGVNAVAHSCYDYRMPGKKDDVSFAVTHLDVERGIALGIITRIIRQNL